MNHYYQYANDRDFGRPTFSLLFLFAATFSVAGLIALFNYDYGFRTSYGVFSPYAPTLLLAIYVWKYVIINLRSARQYRRMAFCILLLVSLPFVCWKCHLAPLQQIRPLGLWIGCPIWILTLPVVSFCLFDLKKKFVSRDEYFARSLIEIFAVFPVWSCLWLLLNLQFGWIGVYWFNWGGC